MFHPKRSRKSKKGSIKDHNLSNVQPADAPRPLAITVSDLHFSDFPPKSRNMTKEEWYAAMKEHCKFLHNLQAKLKCPILYAGDIFHKWNSSVELVNFVGSNLPFGYAIPGQHDLPYHDTSSMYRTGFWNLVAQKSIQQLLPKPIKLTTSLGQSFFVSGFGWGEEAVAYEPNEFEEGLPRIAVTHAYIWQDKDTSHPGASKEKYVKKWLSKLTGYNFLVFGDNHRGFVIPKTDTTPAVVNNGTFMRRRSDEESYNNFVTVLYDSGKVMRYFVMGDMNKYNKNTLISPKDVKENVNTFLETVESLSDKGEDFITAVKEVIKSSKIKPATAKLLLKIMKELGND